MSKKHKPFMEADLHAMGMIEIAPNVFRRAKIETKHIGSVSTFDGKSTFIPHPLFCKEVEDMHKKKVSNGDLLISFDIDPIGKPRMTQRDQWRVNPNDTDPDRRQRPSVTRYYLFKNKLLLQAGKFTMPASNYQVIAHIEMPKSWPKTKKQQMVGTPHQQKPDKDNIEKALLDCLCKEDSYVWDGRVTKLWAWKGKIDIKYIT